MFYQDSIVAAKCSTDSITLLQRIAPMSQNDQRNTLVITRREGEIVVIGDENMPMGEIEIVEIQGSRVRVAFRFPDHIRIMRKEIADNWSEKKGNT
jgi:carbon storage regulator CsrA